MLMLAAPIITSEFAELIRLDLIVRLLIAAVLGGAIGLERELSGKPAGFRTNLLICVGSALFTDLSMGMSEHARAMNMGGDPGRIAAQIVSGVGFLGAGAIMQAKGSVTGLTTAATMWVVAAIGMAVGANAFAAAFSTTTLVLIALYVLGKVEWVFVARRRKERSVTLSVLTRPAALHQIEDVLQMLGYAIDTVNVERMIDGQMASVVATGPQKRWQESVDLLTKIPDVRAVERS
jgi:putative Mg2+ transporter-C (MgtC) family protein